MQKLYFSTVVSIFSRDEHNNNYFNRLFSELATFILKPSSPISKPDYFSNSINDEEINKFSTEKVDMG